MKQRLLLALLMLLTSAGFLKAEITITVPKGATPTITVSDITTGQEPVLSINGSEVHKFTTSALSYQVKADAEKDQTLVISNNPHKGLTITGKISNLELNSYASLETVKASGVELTSFTLTAAPGLKSLDLSNNKLTVINVAAASKLETLNVADNKIVDLGILPSTLLDLNIANNGFSISSVTWDLTTALPKLTKLNIGGNKLVDVKVPTTCTNFTKGIQDFTHQSQYKPNGSYVKANENLDITKMAENYGLSLNISSATDWKKKVNSEYQATTEAQTIGTGNSIIYRFFDANKVYTKGDYECVLVRKDNGFQYRVRLTVDPAEFTTKWEAVPNAILTVKNGNSDVATGIKVTQGDVLSIGVTPEEGYSFVKFKDAKNLELANNSAWTKNPVECKVVGKFVSSSEKGEIVSIAAETTGKLATISWNTPAIETGTITVQKIESDGSLTPVNNNAQLPYGSKLQITLTPQLGYTTKLVINDAEQGTGTPNDKGQYVIEYTVETDCKISAQFAKSTMVKLTGVYNGAKLTSDQSFNVKQENRDGAIGENGFDVVAGRPCQVTFTLGSAEVLKQVRLNEKDITKEVIKVSSSTSNTYHFNFTPEIETVIYVSTTKQQTITIKPAAVEQKFVYDGTSKAFAFETEPAGLESKVDVFYKSDADAVAKQEAPKRVDRYAVTFKVKEDYVNEFSVDASNMANYRVEITKATPKITTIPTVTIKDDKYVWTGGAADVAGKFIIDDENVAAANKEKAHMVTVKFNPDDSDNYNFAEVDVEVVPAGAEALERMTVNLESTLPEGIESVSLLNKGTVPAKFGSDKFVEGTELIVLVKYAEGVDPAKIEVYQTLLSTDDLDEATDYSDAASRIKAFKYTVPGGTQAETLDVQVADAPTYTYSVVLKAQDAKAYTGEPQLYDVANNITLTRDEKDAATSALDKNIMTISYKLGNVVVEGSPVNVGEYTVCVSIKAGNGYKAFYQEYEGKFSIKKAIPTINEWPKVQPIAMGQKLKFAAFVGGGSSDISGYFQWLNLESTPKNGDKCKVKFIPDDQKNYEEVINDEGLIVTVTDQRLVTYYTNFPGQTDITVKDKSGNYYESGDPVVKGTVLSITTATINNDLELASLSVAGATKNSDGTYTVGDASIEISATFQVKTKPGNFKVTVPEYLRGAIITGGGEHVVAEGGTLSFTVATASADASKVSVKASNGTVTKGSNGRYTLSGLTANSTVTVSLSNPTALKVDIQKSYLNAGKYHVATVEVESDYTDGKFYYGDEITVVAYPESGVKFEKWSDGSKDQVHDIVLTGDLKLTATFSGTPTGIEDIMAASIATGKGCVWVRGIANADVTIVSIAGRVQARQRISGDTRIDVPAGIYVVVLESGSDVKRVKVIVK